MVSWQKWFQDESIRTSLFFKYATLVLFYSSNQCCAILTFYIFVQFAMARQFDSYVKPSRTWLGLLPCGLTESTTPLIWSCRAMSQKKLIDMSSLVLNLMKYPSTVRHGATEAQCLSFRVIFEKCKHQGNNNFIHVHKLLYSHLSNDPLLVPQNS